MALSVTFCVNVSRDVCMDGQELLRSFENHRAGLLKNEDFEGAILIAPADGPRVKLDVFLESAVQTLCFRGAIDLRAGRGVVVQHSFYPGTLRLDPEGSTTVLSGDFVPTVRLQTDELILALYQCGREFIELFHRVRGEDPEYGNAIIHLEEEAERARQALSLRKGE